MPFDVDPALPVPANLKRAKETLQMLGYTYGHTDVLMADSPCTLVPDEYAASDSLRDFYLQNFPLMPSHHEVMCGDVCGGKVKLLFGVDKALLKWVDTLFPGASVSHSLQPVLAYLINIRARKFLVSLHEKRADLLFVDGDRLQYVNTFDAATADDVAFYVLSVWKMLGLSQTDETLTLVGKQTEVRAARHVLGRFIRSIDTLLPAEAFHGTELARLDGIPFDLCTLVSGYK